MIVLACVTLATLAFVPPDSGCYFQFMVSFAGDEGAEARQLGQSGDAGTWGLELLELRFRPGPWQLRLPWPAARGPMGRNVKAAHHTRHSTVARWPMCFHRLLSTNVAHGATAPPPRLAKPWPPALPAKITAFKALCQFLQIEGSQMNW